MAITECFAGIAVADLGSTLASYVRPSGTPAGLCS